MEEITIDPKINKKTGVKEAPVMKNSNIIIGQIKLPIHAIKKTLIGAFILFSDKIQLPKAMKKINMTSKEYQTRNHAKNLFFISLSLTTMVQNPNL